VLDYDSGTNNADARVGDWVFGRDLMLLRSLSETPFPGDGRINLDIDTPIPALFSDLPPLDVPNPPVFPHVLESESHLAYFVSSVPQFWPGDADVFSLTVSVDVGPDAPDFGPIVIAFDDDGNEFARDDLPLLVDQDGTPIRRYTFTAPRLRRGEEIAFLVASDRYSSGFGNFGVSVTVEPVCHADLNGDGLLDLDDIGLFITAFVAQDDDADLNGDGIFDLTDVSVFVTAFVAGCL